MEEERQEAEEQKRECPNCFYVLDEGEDTCPNCGHRYGDPVGPTEREIKQRRFKVAKFIVTALLVAITAAAAIIGKTYGNWWWALLGFGLGVVLSFAVTFCMELAKWYVTVRPYESADVLEEKTEEEQSGGDSGDGGTN